MTQRGFTLIEVLVSIAIVAILTSILLPIVGITRRATLRIASQCIMNKTDAALKLFRSEMGALPYQRSYADIDAGAAGTNRLFYHLGTTIANSDLLNLHADAAAAAARYDYPVKQAWNGVSELTVFASIHTYRQGDVVRGQRNDMSSASDANSGIFGPLGTAVILNRMAKERARLAIFAGNPQVVGIKLPDDINADGSLFDAARADPTATTPLLGSPTSLAKPGWASDYLKGNLESKYVMGETILDAYFQPLLYVCQVVEGVRPPRSPAVFDNFTSAIDQTTYNFTTAGRKRLVSGLADDPPALPDGSQLRHSDRRTYAAPGYDIIYELWSVGRDGKASWMRDDARNRDNIPMINYDKALP